MIIGIGNDHRGFKLKKSIKQYLEKCGYDVLDLGSQDEISTDYPIYAFQVGENLNKGKIELGILICRTGIGMSIACNKVKGIRCGKVDTKEEAKLCKIDNNCNVIALSYEKSFEEIKEILDAFINTKYTNEERHANRIAMITNYENGN